VTIEIAAGASTIRSARREAENTVMVSMKERSQSTSTKSCVVSPAAAVTSAVLALVPRVRLRTWAPAGTASKANSPLASVVVAPTPSITTATPGTGALPGRAIRPSTRPVSWAPSGPARQRQATAIHRHRTRLLSMVLLRPERCPRAPRNALDRRRRTAAARDEISTNR
jgi:hypothetical protein